MTDEAAGDSAARAFLAGEAKEILRLLAVSDVEELELSRGDVRLVVRRASEGAEVLPAPELTVAGQAESLAAAASSDTILVLSPVVGWFRRSSQPSGGPALVELGQEVHVGQQLGVVEAVQVVHDVLCEVEATVVDILVTDGQGVEYGQPLFRLRT